MSGCERDQIKTHKHGKTKYNSDVQTTCELSTNMQQQENGGSDLRKNGQKVVMKAEQAKMLQSVLATYIPVQIIQKVQNNNTRSCKYLLFHLPFTLLLCDTLQLHFHPNKTALFEILLDQIKRLQELDAKPPRQLPSEEVMGVIVSAVNLEKVPKGHFLRELGKFVEKYSVKLSTFLPYYDALFRLVLRRDTYISKQASVQQLNGLLSATIAEVRAKYHNFDLQ